MAAAVEISGLEYSYDQRQALAGVSFEVGEGEIFGLLGPNGGGKTTLFKILSTLLSYKKGSVRIMGLDAKLERTRIRQDIGVVFQSPSLDEKLSVTENLTHHGHLYGIRGTDLSRRIESALARLGLDGRARQRVETLSGGLKRRVELAKGLLSTPRLLILDEPTTGLDPGARRDVWQHIGSLNKENGTTVVFTTHLMEEAEHCHRLAIIDRGRIVSTGTPEELRNRIGGDVIVVRTRHPQKLAPLMEERFNEKTQPYDGGLRLEKPDGHNFIKQLVEAFPDLIDGVSLSKPTLEDVFVHETGHKFWTEQ
ncbi:MAG: ABC transporter ATP-binding protein [Deltaproteobacteria bacterium]